MLNYKYSYVLLLIMTLGLSPEEEKKIESSLARFEKRPITLYIEKRLLEEAFSYNIIISHAATQGIKRAIKKAELMAKVEEQVEQELNKMEF